MEPNEPNERLQMALYSSGMGHASAGLELRERRSLDEILKDARECSVAARSRSLVDHAPSKHTPDNAVKGAKDNVYVLDGAIEEELQGELTRLVERVHSAVQPGNHHRSEEDVLEDVLREDEWEQSQGSTRPAVLEQRMLAMAQRSQNNNRRPSRRSMEMTQEVERSSSSASLPQVAPLAPPPLRRSSLVLPSNGFDGARGARHVPNTPTHMHARGTHEHSQGQDQPPSLLSLIRQQREEQEQQQQQQHYQQQQQRQQAPRAARWKREFGMALQLPSGGSASPLGGSRDLAGRRKSSLSKALSAASLQHHASPTASLMDHGSLHESAFHIHKGSSPNSPQLSLSPSPLALSRESSSPCNMHLEHTTKSCPQAHHSRSTSGGGSGAATPVEKNTVLPGSPLARSSLKGTGGLSGGRRSVDIPETTRPRLSLLLPPMLPDLPHSSSTTPTAAFGGSAALDASPSGLTPSGLGSAAGSPVGAQARRGHELIHGLQRDQAVREGGPVWTREGGPLLARCSVDRAVMASVQAEREGVCARRRLGAGMPTGEREGLAG